MTIPTYPARPIHGGPIDRAAERFGSWCYEPKYNGWRALVHAPTGAMYNRHGKPLSVQGEFTAALVKLKRTSLGWLDCEALERRHNIGRGTLIILDALTLVDGTPIKNPLSSRRQLLDVACAFAGITPYKDLHLPMPGDSAFSTMQYCGGERQLWDILKQCNAALGCPFYEGLVAKRADSTYPFQMRNPEESFPFWIKHRWAF